MHCEALENWWWSSFKISEEGRRRIENAFFELLRSVKQKSEREPSAETVAVIQSPELGPILEDYVHFQLA